MTYLPGDLRIQSREIILARNWGLSVLAALLGLGVFASEVRRIRELPADPVNYAYLVALAVTGVLIFVWIWSTQHELELLFDWLDPERYVPPSSVKETLMIVGLAVIGSMLFLAARDAIGYGVVFVLYSSVNWWAGRYNYTEISLAIKQSKRRLANDPTVSGEARHIYANGLAVLEDYYMRRPLVPRCGYLLAAAVVGLGCAIMARWSGDRGLEVAAYACYVATIVVSELVIGIWRSRRDRALRVAGADLTEFRRATTR